MSDERSAATKVNAHLLAAGAQSALSRVQAQFQRLRVVTAGSLRIPLTLSLAALIVAIFVDLPYDFFVLLRVIVFVTGIIALAALWKTDRSTNWVWILLTVTVLYNPVLPIHLHRET
jgi:hypothetical protein